MTALEAKPGDRIWVRRTGAFGRPVAFTATVLEVYEGIGYRIRQDDTGKRWVMASTEDMRSHGWEQTIEIITEEET